MVSQTLTIGEGVKTHRPSAQRVSRFSQEANEHRSASFIAVGPKKVNAKSMLSVAGLNICPGMKVTLSADGPDEKKALKQLVSILA